MPNYTTKQCPVCGKEYSVLSYNARRSQFCGRSCGRINQARVARESLGPVRYDPEENIYILPIGMGCETIIDACDADLLDVFWSTQVSQHRRYAKRNVGKNDVYGYERAIHRIIMSRILGRPLTREERVDHVRGIGLDNRRSNLRLATPAQNAANSLRHKVPLSGYKGVYRDPRGGRFSAKVMKDGKPHCLGTFPTAELAHEAYIKRAKDLFGEFANDGTDNNER
jgi:endogenous inhibitor of DNA gyrase (YacG/DUF329 family)